MTSEADDSAVFDDQQIGLLVALVPDAAIVVDGDGIVVAANERVRRLFGHEVGELVGRPVETLVPERLRHDHRDHRRGFAEAPRARTMGAGLELYGRRADGSEFPVDISLAPVRTAHGQGVVAAIRDLSERKAVAATEAQLAAIVRSSGDAIISTSADGVVTSWNPGAERLFGYPPEEAVGQHVSMLIPDEHSEDFEALLAAAQRDEPTSPRDTCWRTRGGVLVDCALSVSAITSAYGGVIGFSAVLRDVTERKRAETELKRLFREEQRRERQQTAAADIRLALLSGEPTPEVLRMICDRTRDLLGAELALVARWLDGGLEVTATSTGGQVPEGLLDDPFVTTVLKSGKAEAAPGGPPASGAALCAPVISDQAVVGVLVVAGGDRGEPYDQVDVLAAATLADQAALGLQLEKARADRERLVLVADRERIARDLHDLVIQRLFAVGMMLQASIRLTSDEHVTSRVGAAVDDLDATIREIRTVIFELGSPLPERSGVRAQVLELAERAAESLGFDPVVHFEGAIDSALPDDVVPHLLAAVGEALTNVARHARASRTRLDLAADAAGVLLVVEDDGVGMGDTSRASGLANLRERAHALGGELAVASAPGGGTRLTWRVPA